VAIIKLGALVAGIRGTVGGVIYTAGKSGPYARAWAKGANSRRQGQQLTRGRFSALGTAWQGLTASQRSGWDTLAAADPEPTYNSLGELESLSGWQYFLRVNARRLKLGLSIEGDAATGTDADRPDPLPITGFGATAASSGFTQVFYDGGGAPAGAYAVVFCAVRPTLGSVYIPGRPVWCAFQLVPVAGYAVTFEAAGIFGSLQPGWFMSCSLYAQSAFGLRSTAETDTTEVT